MVVDLQNGRPSGVNICHQLMALRVPSIGMVSPGKAKISQLNSLANSDETAKPFKEDQRIAQMHITSPFRASLR